ncbi:MAG TPA: hypothetical protein VM911_02950 [Pyrinomonadaceae bacterium]|nr:hypothetical protein [Pyrinomonadaceae bacterium]
MKRILLLCAICMLLGLSNVVLAQGHRRGHDRARIRRGIATGQITRDEARLLRERRRSLREQRRDFRSDGRLARDERRELRRNDRHNDRLIRRLRRNDDRRGDFDNRGNHRRGDGYYRRGAGSSTHPVFGRGGRRGRGRH